ncbi:hypothetical protein [Paenibacillus sp. 1P07SE]|uniref:hypothetical protein n=1 Tax=Paenibacillus sp. 1P07SE TaxID=3132209 RepID=UPI0039A53A71
MKQKKWLIAITAAGLLATSAGAGAGALMESVTGIQHGDVKVTVDGSETALKPVYIDGKAYLPARETADLLGYNLNWSSQELILKERDAGEQEPEVQLLDLNGVIISIEESDGVYRVEVMGHGPNPWLVLSVDEETELTGTEGTLMPADLQPGMKIEARYGPAMTKSLPPQSQAHVIIVGERELSGEQLKTYRDAAWHFVSEQEKTTVLTKPEEARVEIVPAQTAGIRGSSDQLSALEALVKLDGQMVTVTYKTERDALLGPLTVVLHPETADLLGYFIRK